MKNILKMIDRILCNYFGLGKEIITPTSVEMKDGKLFISNTGKFRRHCYVQNWEEFNMFNLNQVNQENKEKLGIAAGKAIAKNFVVSFEKFQIESEILDA